MKIGLAQIRPKKGEKENNLQNHVSYIKKASQDGCKMILFPELSVTGYEPKLAKELALDLKDERLAQFQSLSNQKDIIIVLGAPIKTEHGITISLVIFQPNKPQRCYSKQQLHSDELPYFVCGKEQIILTIGAQKIAPAICYESLQESHLLNAKELGATIYVASVAKPQRGIDKAQAYFPKMAQKHEIPILLCNNVGFNDNFLSTGQSTSWDMNGKQGKTLEESEEGLLIVEVD